MKPILSKKKIKKIEKRFAGALFKYNDVDDFLKANPDIKDIVKSSKAIEREIDKQLKIAKALQPGIVTECVHIQTMACMLGATKFIDFETTKFEDVPRELSIYIDPLSTLYCPARYGYYDEAFSIIILQCGNPTTRDAFVICGDASVAVEDKDRNALYGDKDLTYDEDGKLIITDSVPEHYIPYIKRFNDETSVIEMAGHNYQLFNGETDESRSFLLRQFAATSGSDIILTTDPQGSLIALFSEDIATIFPDGTVLTSTKGSEIRTTGKNSLKPFTEQYLNKTLAEKDVLEDEHGVCRVSFDNSKVKGWVKGKGKDFPTRFKTNSSFFIQAEHVTIADGYYEFLKNKIKQCKASIAMHVQVIKTKKQIKEQLYPFLFYKCKSAA